MDGDDPTTSLLDATFLVPTPDEPAVAGRWERIEVDVVSMLMDEDDAGLLVPAFTSPEALGAWRPEGGCYVERPASWLFGVASADPDGRVVIDSASPTRRILGPEQVAALASGSDPDAALAAGAAPASGPVLVATPADPLPDELADAVRAALAAEQSVRGARLLLVDATGEGLRPVVMVDLAEGRDPTGIDETMTRVVGRLEGVDGATNVTFGLVTDDWRAAYESGGVVLA